MRVCLWLGLGAEWRDGGLMCKGKLWERASGSGVLGKCKLEKLVQY